MFIRVFQNASKVEIDIWPFILVLDLVHTSKVTKFMFVQSQNSGIEVSALAASLYTKIYR